MATKLMALAYGAEAMKELREGIRLLRSADYIDMPWANGFGTTRQLVRVDNEKGRLLFRCSIADVVQPGPISSFPGIDRTLMLLSGKGFVFESPPRSPQELRVPGQSVTFSGGVLSGAGEVFGPSKDLNVMAAVGSYRVTTSVVTSFAQVSCSGETTVFVYIQDGTWMVAIRDQKIEICQTESLLYHSTLSESISISGGGSLALIELVHQPAT